MEKWRQLAIDAAKDKNLSDRIPDKLEQHGSSMVSFFLMVLFPDFRSFSKLPCVVILWFAHPQSLDG